MRRTVLVVTGGVFVIIAAVMVFRPKKAAAAPSAPTPPSPSDLLNAKVQQERKDELAQWQIVARTSGRVLQDIENGAPNPPLQADMTARYNEAQVHITQLTNEIAAHGG
jgi:hypothetical protein